MYNILLFVVVPVVAILLIRTSTIGSTDSSSSSYDSSILLLPLTNSYSFSYLFKNHYYSYTNTTTSIRPIHNNDICTIQQEQRQQQHINSSTCSNIRKEYYPLVSNVDHFVNVPTKQETQVPPQEQQELEQDDEIMNGIHNNDNCRIYFAESTIPNAGYGLFAGVTIEKDTMITQPGDPLIPLFNLQSGSILFEYTWGGRVVKLVFGPGMAAIPNCLFSSINTYFIDSELPGEQPLPSNHLQYDVVDNTSEQQQDNVQYNNPIIGSSTIHYTDNGGYALYTIPIGNEIFIDYGTNYFTDINRIHKKFGLVPFPQHYTIADTLLHDYRRTIKKIVGDAVASTTTTTATTTRIHVVEENNNHNNNDNNNNNNNNSTSSTTIINTNKRSTTIDINDFSIDLYTVVTNVMQLWPNRVIGALPAEAKGVNYMLDTLLSTINNYNQRNIRSLQYLQQNGSCMDHITIKPYSTVIPYKDDIQYGIYANKLLTKGTIVAPLPLLHLPRSSLSISTSSSTTGNDSIDHYQLLLNYCFGHNKSSIVFCPYGVASSLVNHASSSTSSSKSSSSNKYVVPNVKLQWNYQLTRNNEWFQLPPSNWSSILKSSLVMNMIAIKDIMPNDEIVLDYGIEWENAYNNYITNIYPKRSTHYMFQQINTQSIVLPIYTEPNTIVWDIVSNYKQHNTIVPDVHLWCQTYAIVFQSGYTTKRYNTNELPIYYPCRIIHKQPIQSTVEQQRNTKNTSISTDVEYTYGIEILIRLFDVPDTENENNNNNNNNNNNSELNDINNNNNNRVVNMICTEITSGKVLFGFQRDTFLYGQLNMNEYNPILMEHWTFRHDIRIPDTIFPNIWKDLE